jgi:hypothetical protein
MFLLYFLIRELKRLQKSFKTACYTTVSRNVGMESVGRKCLSVDLNVGLNSAYRPKIEHGQRVIFRYFLDNLNVIAKVDVFSYSHLAYIVFFIRSVQGSHYDYLSVGIFIDESLKKIMASSVKGVGLSVGHIAHRRITVTVVISSAKYNHYIRIVVHLCKSLAKVKVPMLHSPLFALLALTRDSRSAKTVSSRLCKTALFFEDIPIRVFYVFKRVRLSYAVA